MKIDRMLFITLLAGLILSPSVYGITISVGGDAGGFTENINVGDKDAVYSSTVIAANSLSHSIEGSGNLKESHRVSNTAGAKAEVGVDIRQAEWYSYSYDLWPGQGSSWPASKFAQVAASEQLDVFNAKYIQAYANAFNAKGYSAGVSIVVSDPGKEASLTGYRNLAMASKNEAFASQTAESAFSLDGFIQADSGADFTRLLSKPLRFREDTADASLRVDRGSVEGYSDLASASANGVTASQQMDAATGDQIRTSSESASWTASFFQGLKKTAGAKVSTRAEGTLTGYNASAENSKDYAMADQAGHIVGTFTSTATAGSASKTRTSNYGTEYDFNMQAKKDASGSYATGTLGYYVDNVSPGANRIQGAVDASESGDAINVLPGTYFENVVIEKSLDILGAGADETVIDGNQMGSVFKIGETNSDIDVALSGLAITNGSGTPNEYGYASGGGIYSRGRTTIKDCHIYGNSAEWHGGGVLNWGTATITDSTIFGNSAYEDGGGVMNAYGSTVTITNSTITGNSAYWDGGGVYSSGRTAITITGSTISGNSANEYGGGVYNEGTATITDSTISGNSANWNGGGIYSDGTATISGSVISGNLAGFSGGGVYSAGGVFNSGMTSITKSTISGNSAHRNGGGVSNEYGTMATIADSTISGNIAYEDGGGVSNAYGSTATISNCTVSGNSAYWWGGGVLNSGMATISGSSISGNSAVENGGGIFSIGTANILENSTVTWNIADSDNDGVGTGGGIYWSDSTLNFIDANGDGIVDPNTIVFDNYLGNGDVNNIEPLLPP